MSPLILTLAVLTASCALVMALAIAWGRRQLRAPSTVPVTLYVDDPALGIRLHRLHQAERERIERITRKPTHPLRISHIRLGRWSLLVCAVYALGCALGCLIIAWALIAAVFAL